MVRLLRAVGSSFFEPPTSQFPISQRDKMTTTHKAIDALVAHLGFDPPRCRAVARRLKENGTLPLGHAGKAPELEIWHFIDLLIGVCVDVPLRAVPETVALYRGLAPGAANMTGAPSHLRKSAGDYLDILAEMAASGTPDDRRDVSKSRIEIVSTWPEIAVQDVETTFRFQPVGSLPDVWQGTKHRQAITINGAAFVKAVRELFAGETI
ncbi:hypothetical protein KXS15_09560 [Sinorhizobium meliloti]|uniref:hypothetical protein n=1 Tax=Rhizobium meliloti TaxID=382 RepID=UPI003F149A7E